MPTTLNAQARWKVRSQTERRHHGGSTEAKIDPAAVAVPQPGATHLNHWPRSTQLHLSDTSRSFSFPAEESACNEEVEADWQRRYDHEREREKRWSAGEKRGVCFLSPEKERHPIVLWRLQAQERGRETQRCRQSWIDFSPSVRLTLEDVAILKMYSKLWLLLSHTMFYSAPPQLLAVWPGVRPRLYLVVGGMQDYVNWAIRWMQLQNNAKVHGNSG